MNSTNVGKNEASGVAIVGCSICRRDIASSYPAGDIRTRAKGTSRRTFI